MGVDLLPPSNKGESRPRHQMVQLRDGESREWWFPIAEGDASLTLFTRTRVNPSRAEIVGGAHPFSRRNSIFIARPARLSIYKKLEQNMATRGINKVMLIGHLARSRRVRQMAWHKGGQ